MNSKSLGASAVYAWPTAQVSVMYPRGAVTVLHKRLLTRAVLDRRAELTERLVAEYQRTAAGLARVVAEGHVDEVIDPATTRTAVARSLDVATPASGRHTNIPL